MGRLTLSLLGAFETTLDGKLLTGFKTDKARALLAYLAVERGRAHRRQTLAGLLWLDYPEEGARANLRHALANLRGVLMEEQNEIPFLLVEGETIQFNSESDCWLDVADFERLTAGADIADLDSAILLYRGGFLEGFTLKDSPDFDNWTAILREKYLGFASKALGRLAEGYEQNKEYGQAIGCTRRQLELEPWQEEAHRQLMYLLALNGQRVAALVQYESCCKILKEEYGVEPSIETKRLQAGIRDGEISVSKPEKTRLHNLPAQVTSFIGREKEMEQAKSLLQAHRLVTLTGSGGAGKTRLSLQTGMELLEQYLDGIWLVELAPLADPELVMQTVARTLGMRLEASPQTLSLLEEYLEEKHLLLIVDNCEHMIEVCAQLADALLKTCPHLAILATSREPLGIAGEASYRVPPLSLPDPQNLPPLETLEQYEAVHLFVERAGTTSPAFQLTPENAPTVAQICQRLDGIPLAIELAAARLKVLRVEEIAARLDDRFRLLTGGSRAALPRYQTLRSSIDWSYELLAENERELLLRLSVYMGGWTLEEAEFMGCGDGIEECEILDLLAQLVDKSLVIVEAGEGVETRYKMLETIRQYALAKLVEAGQAEGVCDQHLRYYVNLAESSEDKLKGSEMPSLLTRLETELNNIRLALQWSLEGKTRAGWTPEPGLRLAAALQRFWHSRCHHAEGFQWLSQLLTTEAEERGDAPITPDRARHRAKALLVAGLMAGSIALSNKKLELHEESRNLYQSLGLSGKLGYAQSLLYLGTEARYRGDHVYGLKLLEESLSIFQFEGDQFGEAECFMELGTYALIQYDFEASKVYLTKSLDIRKEIGEKDGVTWILLLFGKLAVFLEDTKKARSFFEASRMMSFEVKNDYVLCSALEELGILDWAKADYEKAKDNFNQSLMIARRQGYFGGIAYALSNLGNLALSQGNNDQATDCFKERLAFSKKVDNKVGIAWALYDLGTLAWVSGDMEQAAQKFPESLNLITDSGLVTIESYAFFGMGRVFLDKGEVKLAKEYLNKSLEKSSTYSDPLEIYPLLEFISYVEIAQHGMLRSTRLLGSTEAWFKSFQTLRSPKERELRSYALTELRTILGELEFVNAREEGKRMTLKEAVEYALGE